MPKIKARKSSRPSPILSARTARQGMSSGPQAARRYAVGGGNWRSQLPPGARDRIVNKITETLKKHLPVPGSVEEGLWLGEIQNIAVQFEDRVYTVATSQSNYLRKISEIALRGDSTEPWKCSSDSKSECPQLRERRGKPSYLMEVPC